MKKPDNKIYGGIEAGGTKFVCAIGSGLDRLLHKTQFPTTTPEETIARALDFFKTHRGEGPLTAVGIASFGPLDLNPQSPTFGYITGTPKAGWADTNLAGLIREAVGIAVEIDTDVNCAALGEQQWGAARGLDSFIYLTVGTGIGGGGLINGKLIHGLIHPEMGHIRIPHDLGSDPFPGSCTFHKDCWEGLASGQSMEKRWGRRPELIPPDHPAWKIETDYLSTGVANLICTLSPQRIIVGGGIMKNPNLLPAMRIKVQELLNNYVSSSEITERIEDYLVQPGLGDMAGVSGAIALARQLK